MPSEMRKQYGITFGIVAGSGTLSEINIPVTHLQSIWYDRSLVMRKQVHYSGGVIPLSKLEEIFWCETDDHAGFILERQILHKYLFNLDYNKEIVNLVRLHNKKETIDLVRR